jgi:hypothetical protein
VGHGAACSIASGLTSSIASGMVSSMTDEKVRENQLRRRAERQGYQLVKSRRRDPYAVDYGTYMLVDPATNAVVAYGLQSGFGLSLDAIEAELDSRDRPAPPRRRRSAPAALGTPKNARVRVLRTQLTAARRALNHALNDSAGVNFTDEERELLAHSFDKLDELLAQVEARAKR